MTWVEATNSAAFEGTRMRLEHESDLWERMHNERVWREMREDLGELLGPATDVMLDQELYLSWS